MEQSTTFTYGGAQALTELHATHIRSFLSVWQQAKAAGITPPACEDPDYDSLEHILAHVLGAARGYMVWMCECLELPDPGIPATPDLQAIEKAAGDYTEVLIDRWRDPLVGMTEEQSNTPAYLSGWKVLYCIDAMLEHAVMHPIRHEHQLRKWLATA